MTSPRYAGPCGEKLAPDIGIGQVTAHISVRSFIVAMPQRKLQIFE